jgi:hypothetical protein
MLGTREARVLVVEAVGSRSWSERTPRALAALPQGRSAEGEQVRRKPHDPLTRTAAAQPQTWGESRGAVMDRAQSPVLGRRGTGSCRCPNETVRGRYARTSQGRHHRSGLSGAVRRRVWAAETLHGSAEAGSQSGTTEVASSRSSIFSFWGDGSSKRGDGGTILVSR